MARYWKMHVYTDGDEYETRETLLDEPKFRQIQKAIADGADFIMFEDRVIKRKMIKEIVPADSDVKEYLDMGVSLKTLGLTESASLPDAKESGFTKIQKQLN